MANASSSDNRVVIRADGRGDWRRLVSVWDSRDLLRYLVKRDLSGRYRPTSLGRSWIVLKPTLEILVYVLVFGVFLRLGPEGVPYPLFLVGGLVPWLFFSQAVNGSANVLTASRHLMSKVYFPRLVVPLTNMSTALIDFLVLAVVVAVLFVAYWHPVDVRLVFLPLFVLLLVCFAFGLGLLVASWSVWKADVALATNVLMRLWFYLTPVIYPISRVPEEVRPYYDLNPTVTLIQSIRWSVGLTPELPASSYLLLTFAVSVLALVWGLRSFFGTERRMVDFL